MLNGNEALLSDVIAKQKLNVLLLVDTSTSMHGKRIDQVNKAIKEIIYYLKNLQVENTNVDFYMSIMTFDTTAKWVDNKISINVDDYDFKDIKAKGQSNLHLAYDELAKVLKKESQGGIMPDFGGIAPIILLLSDGHPSKSCKKNLLELKKLPWFNVALKYGLAIELNDTKTKNILRDFVDHNGEVIECYDSRLLKQIIKIIVLTASKVKSQSKSYNRKINSSKNSISMTHQEVIQEIQTNLVEVDDWEW